MPNRCSIIHACGIPLSSIIQNELKNFMQQFETRLKPFIDFDEKLDDDDDEALKLGAKHVQNEIEKFINANCQENGKDKWSCPSNEKKFKDSAFIRKHVLNKHQDRLNEVKKQVIYFNIYLCEPKRPQLREKPSDQPGATPTTSDSSDVSLSTTLATQSLLTRAPLWLSMPAPPHSSPPGYYLKQFHQAHNIIYFNTF